MFNGEHVIVLQNGKRLAISRGLLPEIWPIDSSARFYFSVDRVKELVEAA
jgi:hypothetical protein